MPYLGKSISCVIPTKEEQETIRQVIELIPDFVDEVIIIDGSTDQTIQRAKSTERKIRVIEQKSGGKGTALRLGFEAVSREILVTLDADLSHDPRAISALIKELVEGNHDLVVGSRFLGHSFDMTPLRLILNELVNLTLRLLFEVNVTETQNGFRAIKKEAVGKMKLRSDGFPIETEMMIKAAKQGFSISEIPIIEYKRKKGTSKLNIFRLGYRIVKLILRELTNSTNLE